MAGALLVLLARPVVASRHVATRCLGEVMIGAMIGLIFFSSDVIDLFLFGGDGCFEMVLSALNRFHDVWWQTRQLKYALDLRRETDFLIPSCFIKHGNGKWTIYR